MKPREKKAYKRRKKQGQKKKKGLGKKKRQLTVQFTMKAHWSPSGVQKEQKERR